MIRRIVGAWRGGQAGEQGRRIPVNDDIIVDEGRAVEDGVERVVGASGKGGEDVACGSRGGRHIVFDLEAGGGAGGAVAGGGFRVDFARGNIKSEDGALKDLVGGFGLVGWDFVTGLVDAREGKVAVLADLAADVAAVGLDVLVTCGVERGGLTIIHRQRVCFTADP